MFGRLSKTTTLETINEIGELCEVWIPKNTLVDIIINPTSEISEQIINETVEQIKRSIKNTTRGTLDNT